MSGVRPFRADDVPAVAGLRPTAFRSSLQPSPEALARYFERIFLHLPWHDADLPSLVYEDRLGQVRGFLGVLTRRMRRGSTDVRVAVPTQFMVHPEARGVAGVQLMRHFLDGPQDLSLSDRGNDGARKLWERLGGHTALLYSLFWTRALRPVRYGAVHRARGRFAETLSSVAAPIWNLGDAIVRLVAEPAIPQRPPPGSTEPLDLSWLLAQFPRFMAPDALRPVYHEAYLRFVLEEVSAKAKLGTLRSVLVCDAGGQPSGWFIYYENPRGVSQVVQLVARPGHGAAVLGHLFFRAGREGATAVQGRLEPALLAALGAANCQFNREGPWMLVHSRNPDLLAAIQSGEGHAFVSRLDSEWWLNF